ncbi:MAG: methyltransferase domain-containing protein [Eubacteriales bacterium]|nr:methyltransferase domain-containing protein [Eubacteriales bacterium]
MLTYEDFINADKCPAPFEPGEELWNDPYISQMMLEAHLTPDTDAASYRPEIIQAICDDLTRVLKLKKGDSVVDLGCGPGLYCARLAQSGFRLTGIDRSENSIRYARMKDNKSEYQVASYLEPFGVDRFSAALMISQDYGVLSPENRKRLLANVRNALKPNGAFAFDACSMAAFRGRQNGAASKWYASDGGFWRPGKHFVLEKTFFYPDIHALCDDFSVLDADGLKTYHIYQTFFSPETIRTELEENGFHVEEIKANLYGEPYHADSPVLGVICRKA